MALITEFRSENMTIPTAPADILNTPEPGSFPQCDKFIFSEDMNRYVCEYEPPLGSGDLEGSA